MKTFPILCVVFLLLTVTAYTQAATCVDDPPITKTLNAGNNYEEKFEFNSGAIDTKVTIRMQADCEVTVARKCATAIELLNRCDNPAIADIFPEAEEDKTAGISNSRYSYYQIEEASCSDLAFPAEIYISYYGAASKVGSSDAYRLRMIKAPKYSKECTDVTYSVEATVHDPKGGGGEDGYSDFFLVNVYGTALPDLSSVVGELVDLSLDSAPEFDPKKADQAYDEYKKMLKHIKEKNSAAAHADKTKAKDELKGYYAEVKTKRTAGTAKKANNLMKRAQRLQFQIQQAGDLKIPK
ncbi:hypothetical protein L0222_23130 [bacterium]|nr:hypothetical protein [bacterium]MCI0602927.1 hypothetical protein [bacterium]